MPSRKILILCRPDGFANGVWAKETTRLLQAKGYEVIRSPNPRSLSSCLSSCLDDIISSRSMPKSVKGRWYYSSMKRAADHLQVQVNRSGPDAVICLDELDSYVLTRDLGCLKIYACPAPLADELYFEDQLDETWYKKLRDLELEVYEGTDYLCFHWESYTNYDRKNMYNGSNIFVANQGCSPHAERAKWASTPKVVFMGWLGGLWNNLPLLARLSRRYPVDVFGGPNPRSGLNLNYRGYAPTTGILVGFQLGLVTISRDKLRRSGFSSKHLEYISYGLPVLTPEWREDPLLDAVSIKYNESNFLDKIWEYSDRAKWESMSERCYQQSLKWTWEKQLKPMLEVLQKELN